MYISMPISGDMGERRVAWENKDLSVNLNPLKNNPALFFTPRSPISAEEYTKAPQLVLMEGGRGREMLERIREKRKREREKQTSK